ncbi:MerR family transcriptional regulator [Protofrankia symbiont of Coriaria ruscifolia]|uniref:MerR family transcriptional regulator n=1 Tax=Protofrankia symbiont of Coriaria ruscifolia TaxID=1306542 RepID=UPI001041499B|nr:MerR family transcriptional regulator [Protofrankia symbiont of Coriaria ruscifolia]
MRIAELSRHTGVPIPTIKYYVREDLLPPGERTNWNQVQYDDSHVRRLRLVRALVDVGGLSIAATREVLAKIDSPGGTTHDTLGKVQYALTSQQEGRAGDGPDTEASREADEMINRRGWQIKSTSPARHDLAELLAALHGLGQEDFTAVLDDYAQAAEHLAACELSLIRRRTDLEGMLETVAIWTTLGDRVMAAMRRLAQEDASARVGNTTVPSAAANNTVPPAAADPLGAIGQRPIDQQEAGSTAEADNRAG